MQGVFPCNTHADTGDATAPSSSTARGGNPPSKTSLALQHEFGLVADSAISFALRTLSPLRAAQLFVGLQQSGILGGRRGGSALCLNALAPSTLTLDFRGFSPNSLGVAMALLLSELCQGGTKNPATHLFLVTGGPDDILTVRAYHCILQEAQRLLLLKGGGGLGGSALTAEELCPRHTAVGKSRFGALFLDISKWATMS